MQFMRLASPAPGLRQYVRSYGQREVRPGGATLVDPVPARAFPMLCFVFGTPYQVLDSNQSLVETSTSVVVVGGQTRCHWQLRYQGSVNCFVVLFQATGLYRLFSAPLPELTDCGYEGRTVLGAVAVRLEQLLANTASFDERVRITDRFFLSYSLKARAFDRISAAANQILRASGGVRIDALCREAGLSVRQFERCFLQQVGMHPKLFARIIRFEAALDRKARFSRKSWTEVAHEFGYYDHMHMVHDFEGFTGATPTKLLAELEALFQERLVAIRTLMRPANALNDMPLIL